MKTTNVCPKCSNTDIIRVEGSVKPYGAGNNISMGSVSKGSVIASFVKVPRYICGECGYTEEWIDVEDLPKLKKKFK